MVPLSGMGTVQVSMSSFVALVFVLYVGCELFEMLSFDIWNVQKFQSRGNDGRWISDKHALP